MLMLHGFPEFWYSWRHQIPEFAQNYQVVALDLRGYNDSDKPTDPKAYRMQELTADVTGVIQALGHDRCTLVGHDWGGSIAWNIADRTPQFLDRLIVLNFPHPARFAAGLMTPQQLMRSSYIFFFQLPLIPEWVIQSFDYRLITQMFEDTAVSPNAFSSEDIRAYREAIAKPGALTAMLNYYRNILDSGLVRQSWSRIEVPTLMIWGEQDVALGKELTHNTEEFVKDFRIRYIPDAGHWVQQDQPQQVNQFIHEFLG